MKKAPKTSVLGAFVVQTRVLISDNLALGEHADHEVHGKFQDLYIVCRLSFAPIPYLYILPHKIAAT